jgi:hypothetical protein
MKRLTLFIIMALYAAALAHGPATPAGTISHAEIETAGHEPGNGKDAKDTAHVAETGAAEAGTANHAETVPAHHDAAHQEPPEAAEIAIPEEPAPPEPEPTPEPAAPAPATPAKQTIAVYMAGEEPKGAPGVHHILGGELARTISTSDKYLAVDRTDAILEQLSKEHVYQRSGAVDDDQIKSLGRQLGVQYLCISNINNVGWQAYYLDVR